MNNNRCQRQEQENEGTLGVEDIYKQEPGKIDENQPSPNTTILSQCSGTQPTVSVVLPDVFIQHTARQLRLKSHVSDFRNRWKSKGETLAAIHIELNKEPALSTEEKKTAPLLVNNEIDLAETRTQGEHRTVETSTTNIQEREPSEHQFKTHTPKQTQQYDEFFEQNGDNSRPESDAREPTKQIRLTELDMPWYECNNDLNKTERNPSCVKTVGSLRNFNRDIKGCKFLVSIAPRALDNIPPTQ